MLVIFFSCHHQHIGNSSHRLGWLCQSKVPCNLLDLLSANVQWLVICYLPVDSMCNLPVSRLSGSTARSVQPFTPLRKEECRRIQAVLLLNMLLGSRFISLHPPHSHFPGETCFFESIQMLGERHCRDRTAMNP